MASLLAIVALLPNKNDLLFVLMVGLYFFSGSAFCFLANDIFDRKKDLYNNKKRPIATGELSLKKAILFASVFLTTYLLLGYLLGAFFLLLSMISSVSFLLYSPINNKMGLLANVFVAFWATAPIWEIAYINGHEGLLYYLSSILFFMIIAREIMLDWLDTDGDKKIDKKSIPIRYSTKQVNVIIAILLIIPTLMILMIAQYFQLTKSASLFLYASIIVFWVPTFFMFKRPTRKMILANIRISHLTFLFILISIYLR